MTDYKRVNKTRRNRGYAFEKYMVKHLNKQGNYKAVRLGSPSTGLPDVLAVGGQNIITMECKSTMNRKRLYIPKDQIIRCYNFADLFERRYYRIVLLAFKFGRTIFIKHHDDRDNIEDITCTYKGKILQGNKEIYLDDLTREFSL